MLKLFFTFVKSYMVHAIAGGFQNAKQSLEHPKR